jgi:alkaline phosphatase D
MGRPLQIKPTVPRTSRRGFFKATGSAAAVAAAGTLVGRATAAARVFQHGVASGDPLHDRVILWTRVTVPESTKPALVNYIVATDPDMSDIVLRGAAATTAVIDFTVKVDAGAGLSVLQPSTTYYYRFTAGGETSPIGRTKTLPQGPASSLRFAVVSCSSHAQGYFNAYARIAARADLDLVMHLGDYLYGYGAAQYGTVRTPEPPVETVTLTDYRTRHAQYKRDADSQAMHRQHPMIAIWDDQETAAKAWLDGADSHAPDIEGLWSVRVAAALQAYYEWMPVRQPDSTNPRANYRRFAYGDLAELLMLEERLGARSELLADARHQTIFGPGFAPIDSSYADPSRTLLGDEQEAWLIDRLRTSPARWKLLGQGVMFAQMKGPGVNPATDPGLYFVNNDLWDGYGPARDRIFAALAGADGQRRVDDVVVLTGDAHSSWAADLHPNPYNPLVAAGGYDRKTGQGSVAVEFVGTSVTSPGIDTDTTGQIACTIQHYNPHFKYVNLTRRGYMLLDVNPSRVVTEWWYVDTVSAPSTKETFAKALQVRTGTHRLSAATRTPSRPGAPPLAP